jgi:hypothetical protein
LYGSASCDKYQKRKGVSGASHFTVVVREELPEFLKSILNS